MKHVQSLFAVILLVVFSAGFADVVQESETGVEFKGAIGLAMKLSGANQKTKAVEYYAGEQFRSDSFDEDGNLTQSTIYNLNDETITMVNHAGQTYSTLTFEEMAQMFNARMEEIEQDIEEAEAEEGQDVEVSWDVDVERQGSETVNGIDTEKLVLTLTIEATSTEEQQGETVQTTQPMKVVSTMWIGEGGDAAKEIEAFEKRMAETAMETMNSMRDYNMISAIAAGNPQLADAMQKLQEERQDIKGIVIKSQTSYALEETQQSGSKPEPEKKKKRSPFSMLNDLSDKVNEKIAESLTSKTLMESTTEITKLEQTQLEASTFTVPSGYTQEEFSFE